MRSSLRSMSRGSSSPSNPLSIKSVPLSLPPLSHPEPSQIEDALAAPLSLLHEHSKKVTGGAGTAGSIVKKVLIGKVPDRGGRPMAEHRAKAIIAKEGRGGGRGGGGGRGHGGGGGRAHGGNDNEKKRKEEGGGSNSKGSGASKKGRTVTLG
jgi:hypothetical protein